MVHADHQSLQSVKYSERKHVKIRNLECMCVIINTHTRTLLLHTLLTEGFRSQGALGENVICSQTTKLKNDPDTLPS